MRRVIRDWLSGCCRYLAPEGETVLEVGSLQVEDGGGQELADLRPLLPGRTYLGVDLRNGPGVDRVMDAHALALADNSVALVLCIDTAEHIERPWEACREFWRVLRPGGWAVVATVFRYRVHDYPADYWRPTPQGMTVLLRDFDTVWVGADERDNPVSVVGVACKGLVDLPPGLSEGWPYSIRGGQS